jgi:hypothetical protein
MQDPRRVGQPRASHLHAVHREAPRPALPQGGSELAAPARAVGKCPARAAENEGRDMVAWGREEGCGRVGEREEHGVCAPRLRERRPGREGRGAVEWAAAEGRGERDCVTLGFRLYIGDDSGLVLVSGLGLIYRGGCVIMPASVNDLPRRLR